MQQPTFSVIVPVYNVERYLHQCLDSILRQTYPCYEVLLIDDGSTDRSGDICDAAAVQHSQVRVIHQHNCGLSVARNTGIMEASGEYLLFVDSDDVISINALQQFADILSSSKVDIVTAFASELHPNGETTPYLQHTIELCEATSGRDYLEQALAKNAFTVCVPFNVYRREFIVDNQLFFKPGMIHEDVLWTPQTFLLAQTVCTGAFYFYEYRIRAGSITRGSKEHQIRSAKTLINITKELSNFVSQYAASETRWFRDFIAMEYMSATYIGNLAKDHTVRLDRFFPLHNAFSLHQKAKALLFAISPLLYCRINKWSKWSSRK